MKYLKRRHSADKTSEGTHMARGVIGTIVVLIAIGAAFYRWGPTDAREQPTGASVKLGILRP